ncbi:MAG: glutaredoxin family protein [Deltaproteobacteria bacterium]|nr:glutaredoxin family protein [Deltaproteobacteria bacterium]
MSLAPPLTRTLALLGGALVLGFASSAAADRPRNRDDSGRVHSVDSLDTIPAKYLKKVRTISAPPPVPRSAYKPGASAGKKQVDIYVTSWCGYCRKLESFLKSKSIPYTRHDIEKSSSARQAHLKLGGGGIPVVKVGSDIIRGFSPEAILRSLKKK